MTRKPSSVRAVRFPAAYGAPGGPDSLLPWSYIEERVRVASNYWITTVGPNARPHARPVDGVWIDGALCFGGSPETRWVRNLMANPSISVHLSSEAEAIILREELRSLLYDRLQSALSATPRRRVFRWRGRCVSDCGERSSTSRPHCCQLAFEPRSRLSSNRPLHQRRELALWKLLADKIASEGVGSGGERGYRLRGAPHARPRGRTGSCGPGAW